MYSETMRIL